MNALNKKDVNHVFGLTLKFVNLELLDGSKKECWRLESINKNRLNFTHDGILQRSLKWESIVSIEETKDAN